MEDKPLTESIKKQYSKYGSLRTKDKEPKIELCNSEDPLKFLLRIDSSIKDAKARVKKSIDNSSINEEYYFESSYDNCHQPLSSMSSDSNSIPMVNLDRTNSTKKQQPVASTSDNNTESISIKELTQKASPS